MKVIFIENTIYFTHSFPTEESFKTVTNISLPDDIKKGKYLRIYFNPHSSLYDEDNYLGDDEDDEGRKHPSKPPIYFNIWDLGKHLADDSGNVIPDWWRGDVHQEQF